MSNHHQKYFQVDAGTKSEVLKRYDRNDETFGEDVKIMREWLQTQKHLPEIPSDVLISAFLMLNKCRIERTKQKLDMYYTIRGLIPEFFHNVNPRSRHMQEFADLIYCVPLPKLTEELYRVCVYKINTAQTDKINPHFFFAHVYNVAEIRIAEDVAAEEVIIYDLAGYSLGLMAKFSPTVVSKSNVVYEKVFSTPIKGIHFINGPNVVQKLVTLLKSLLKPKLIDRIHVHKDVESLKNYISLDVLPKDYGGNEKSLAELNDLLKVKLVEYEVRFDKLDGMRVNDHLRPEKLDNDDILGFHGNFKKLAVD